MWFALFVSAFMEWIYTFRIATIEVTPLSFAALLFGIEFCYYWFHRGSHRVRWFWCAHVVHHSGENMTTTTAMRQSLFYAVNLHQIFWAPMLIIGFPVWAVSARLRNESGLPVFRTHAGCGQTAEMV